MARMNSSNAFGMKKKKGESKFGTSLLAAASKMETQKSDAKKKEEESHLIPVGGSREIETQGSVEGSVVEDGIDWWGLLTFS